MAIHDPFEKVMKQIRAEDFSRDVRAHGGLKAYKKNFDKLHKDFFEACKGIPFRTPTFGGKDEDQKS